MDSRDLTDKVYDRLGGKVPVLDLGRESIDIDLHAIVKATLAVLEDENFIDLEPAE